MCVSVLDFWLSLPTLFSCFWRRVLSCHHQVNGFKAGGHEATTKVLRTATGKIVIELYRVQLPDPRFDNLCKMYKPKSEVPAYLNVTDIAGLVRGASEGEGLGNEFLSHIQAVDGIFHMIRLFESDEVTHVDDSVDPVRDLETITGELCLKDMA